MKRNLRQLADRHYDVVIVGGGVYGAALARESTLGGLSTALVEKGDFCSATSASSLKIIHGGLRYLQQLDFSRLRNSVTERRAFLRTAPHLVHPLPCVMPTQGHLMKGREAMFCGLLMNEILSCDRNQLKDPEKFIPRGRLVSRATVGRLVPGLATDRFTGGCAWHDAYTYNSERLVTAMVRDAVDSGCTAANYARVTGFQQSGSRITAVCVHDELNNSDFDIPAKLVINAAGPWVNEVLALLDRRPAAAVCGLALGLNVVLARQLLPSSAAGLPFRRRAGESQRLLFLMPWRGQTLAGTYYRPHTGPADALAVTEADIEMLLADLAHAYPAAAIKRGDVAAILAGLLPVQHDRLVNDEPVLANHFSIIDHARRDAIEGLISVVGVKYTTARDVAARTLSMALAKLGRRHRSSGSDRRLLPGGAIPDFKAFLEQAGTAPFGSLPPAIAEHLAYNFGTELRAVLDLGNSQPALLTPLAASTPVIGAEVAFAAREEMAMTLADIVFRRTDLGSAGRPAAAALDAASRIMAAECGWDETRRGNEVRQVGSAPLFGDRPPCPVPGLQRRNGG
jgi:glycerol-3-phosphate dehydrogenase